MKDRVVGELERNIDLKILTGLILVMLFIGSVQIISYEVNQEAESFKESVEIMSEATTIFRFADYYDKQNRTQEFNKTRNISRELINEIQEDPIQQSDSTKLYAASFIGKSISAFDPFYPRPCVLDGVDDCKLYFDKETRNYMERTWNNSLSNESLGQLSEKHNLNVSQEFYATYSSSEPPEAGISILTDKNHLDLVDYIINAVYLILFGFLLSSIALPTYRKLRDELR